MVNKKSNDEKTQKPAKGSMISFAATILLLSTIAVGSGWYLGTNLLIAKLQTKDTKSEIKEKAPAQGVKKKKEDDPADKSTSDAQPHTKASIIKLDPIIVALKGKSRVWLRLELSIVANADAHLGEAAMKARMSSDIAAFLRTVSLRQISGPSGYLHLREDLLDRTRLVTQGKASDVLISTMVFE